MFGEDWRAEEDAAIVNAMNGPDTPPECWICHSDVEGDHTINVGIPAHHVPVCNDCFEEMDS